MGKGSKTGGGGLKSASHQQFKDRAKNRLDDLQGVMSDLSSARKESRTIDLAVLEEQVHQMIREWQAEFNQPSPASSLQQDGTLGSFPTDICQLLQLCDEEDDATSGLPAPKPEPDAQKVANATAFQEGCSVTQVPHEQGFHSFDQCKGSVSGVNHIGANNNIDVAAHLDYHQFDLHQEFDQNFFTGFDTRGICGEALPEISVLPNVCPPPSAFLGPKCALWDCPRPVQCWDHHYCSNLHATIAPLEGQLGMTPVVRPRGIGLKDNLLFDALRAKIQGKDVGVPECEGAATAKSPWNAPELFDLKLIEAQGETIREWLFFDKPRKAFESGPRKQRSLPDYNGRGWHESRKQNMDEFGGYKRSYYMDPQPMKNLEWHLYEYEINKCDACALYRLELKLVDGKKSPKGKISTDSVADLQKQMGRLTAEFPLENKRTVKGRAKASQKDSTGNVYPSGNQLAPANNGFDYGTNVPPYDYLVDDIGYYLT